jgi:hypothetical protein
MDEKTENPVNESRAAHLRDAEAANLDAIIDNALSTYTAGEPEPNLSARILGAVHALEPRRGSRLLHRPARIWAFAATGWLAAAAMLLIWIGARNLQIVVQSLPTAQRAQSAPPALSPSSTTASLKSMPEPPAPRMPHFQHPVRAAVSNPHSQATNRAETLQPIAFAPIVIAPIRSEEVN